MHRQKYDFPGKERTLLISFLESIFEHIPLPLAWDIECWTPKILGDAQWMPFLSYMHCGTRKAQQCGIDTSACGHTQNLHVLATAQGSTTRIETHILMAYPDMEKTVLQSDYSNVGVQVDNGAWKSPASVGTSGEMKFREKNENSEGQEGVGAAQVGRVHLIQPSHEHQVAWLFCKKIKFMGWRRSVRNCFLR